MNYSVYPTSQQRAEQKLVKRLRRMWRTTSRHWVGDGFPVRTLFAYSNGDTSMSPFLLLDYAGPAVFSSTDKRRGVGVHPHRGFETVTIVYEGEVEHRDSSGGGGIIGPGDVQWMTAASGLVHEEFHSPSFARRGGKFEMVQLWVNLPAKDKMASPRYQGIASKQIPVVDLPAEEGTVRVIAGDFAGVKGPAKTFTPIQMWSLCITSDRPFKLEVPDGDTTLIVVLKGAARVNETETITEASVGLFEPGGERILVDGAKGTTALLLSGEPINEPIVGQGPFVMNSASEIRQAVIDYQNGQMGQL